MKLRARVIADVICSVVLASYVCYKYLLAACSDMGHLAFANVRSLADHYLCHTQNFGMMALF
jgi:hypothetical protein